MEWGWPCWRPHQHFLPPDNKFTRNSPPNVRPESDVFYRHSHELSHPLVISTTRTRLEFDLVDHPSSARLWITVCLFPRGDFTPWFSEELYFPRPSVPCSVVGKRPYFTSTSVTYRESVRSSVLDAILKSAISLWHTYDLFCRCRRETVPPRSPSREWMF